MRQLYLSIFAAAFLFGCAAQRPAHTLTNKAAASEIIPSTNLADVVTVLRDGANQRTLLVLDIDDTLLTSASFFGSDAWYEWQKTLSPHAPGYVPCRFDIVAMNYEIGTQRATQADAPQLINSITTDKLILTARSDASRSGTMRELRQAGYALPAALRPDIASLTYQWHSKPDAPIVTVSYRDGIFMVAGQNKGLLLLDLLQRLQLHYARVVLVDDGSKNIEDMRAALATAGIAYTGIHYTRIDKSVSANEVQAGIAGWQAWQQLLENVYPQRWQRLQNNHCAY